ncbi:lytic transglycosylase domain-containing protein [Pseudomonas sp. FSL R10-2964]|uniref:lytic transglycosylase domain-containing protein n=1 Tax=Pseudomonas sp. FSL R10-2964 TaxID=2662202 RepID=UPI002113C15C|nr:lytic transglycosylase domain-containing protein [Pseudomonas sp. FSL R10-2964]
MSSFKGNSINSDALTRMVKAIAVAVCATLAGCQSMDHSAQTTERASLKIAKRIPQDPLWLSQKCTDGDILYKRDRGHPLRFWVLDSRLAPLSSLPSG